MPKIPKSSGESSRASVTIETSRNSSRSACTQTTAAPPAARRANSGWVGALMRKEALWDRDFCERSTQGHPIS